MSHEREATSERALRALELGRRIPERWVWRGLDLAVHPGERLGLEGPSGSGKSLLLRALAGLDPVDEGRVLLDGRDFADWAPYDYRARVVYVHQRPALWEGTVESNLRRLFELGVHGPRGYDASRVDEMLRALGRGPGFLAKASDDLSGGEGQIVALVRALQLRPRVLLLDEPTASMDGAATERAEALVSDWARGDGERAYVWSSHDPAQLERVAARLVRLGAGGGTGAETALAETASGEVTSDDVASGDVTSGDVASDDATTQPPASGEATAPAQAADDVPGDGPP